MTDQPRTAESVGYNIVNQLADLWEVSVDVRQATNDQCWAFAAKLVETAAHPAEPAPAGVGITDEAEAVARSMFEAVHELDWSQAEGPMRAEWLERGRAALQAARPFMTSRPALNREAVLDLFRQDDTVPPIRRQWLADAVMALAVPVPTGQAIEDAVQDALLLSDDLVAGGYSMRIEADADDIAKVARRAVLALLNGSAK